MNREDILIADDIWTLSSAIMNFSDLQNIFIFIFFLLMPNKANFPLEQMMALPV